jgi:hypothetical protein
MYRYPKQFFSSSNLVWWFTLHQQFKLVLGRHWESRYASCGLRFVSRSFQVSVTDYVVGTDCEWWIGTYAFAWVRRHRISKLEVTYPNNFTRSASVHPGNASASQPASSRQEHHWCLGYPAIHGNAVWYRPWITSWKRSCIILLSAVTRRVVLLYRDRLRFEHGARW